MEAGKYYWLLWKRLSRSYYYDGNGFLGRTAYEVQMVLTIDNLAGWTN